MDRFREWLSDNLRYIMLIMAIVLGAGGIVLGTRLYKTYKNRPVQVQTVETQQDKGEIIVVTERPFVSADASSGDDGQSGDEGGADTAPAGSAQDQGSGEGQGASSENGTAPAQTPAQEDGGEENGSAQADTASEDTEAARTEAASEPDDAKAGAEETLTGTEQETESETENGAETEAQTGQESEEETREEQETESEEKESETLTETGDAAQENRKGEEASEEPESEQKTTAAEAAEATTAAAEVTTKETEAVRRTANPVRETQQEVTTTEAVTVTTTRDSLFSVKVVTVTTEGDPNARSEAPAAAQQPIPEDEETEAEINIVFVTKEPESVTTTENVYSGSLQIPQPGLLPENLPAVIPEQQPQTEPPTEPPTEEIDTLYVYGGTSTMYASTSLNVRSGPGTEYEVTDIPDQGDAITVSGETNRWYQVQINGHTGYVRKSLLEEEYTPVYMTSNHTCYLRSEPDYGDNIIGEYYGGTTVEFLGDAGGWYRVRVNGQTGYMGARFFK